MIQLMDLYLKGTNFILIDEHNNYITSNLIHHNIYKS